MGVWRVLIVLVLFVAGMGAGYYTGLTESQRSIDGLDRQLVDSRARIAELEQANRTSVRLVDDLAGRLDRAQSIVEDISRTGGTAVEKVRTTIDNLKRLKEILESQ